MLPREQALAVNSRLPAAGAESDWPGAQWDLLVREGVTGWTIPREFGGTEASAADVLDGCIELARRDLTPVFVLTQFQAACQRIVASIRPDPRERWLRPLAKGECFGTVGISHLTTSRQHTSRPAVEARRIDGGFRLSGEIPWVTGAERSQVLVIGGTLDDGSQFLCAVPSDRDGLRVAPPLSLLALNGSRTGPVALENLFVADEELLTPVVPRVLQQGQPGGAGSLTTSGLATGHAQGSVDLLRIEAAFRPVLVEIVNAFDLDVIALRSSLLASANGDISSHDTAETLRSRATALALNASQALLTATKGAGFVVGHPAERRAREALFFLVWSCPQAVSQKLLRDFSQCESPF